jgi:hypothetical protein
METEYIVTGTLTDARTVTLDEALPLAPQPTPVKVRLSVEPLSASPGGTSTSQEINDQWLAANADKYRGQWVALKDGILIAHSSDGQAFVNAVQDAGVVCPLVLLIPPAQDPAQIGSWDLILPNDHAAPSPIH